MLLMSCPSNYADGSSPNRMAPSKSLLRDIPEGAHTLVSRLPDFMRT